MIGDGNGVFTFGARRRCCSRDGDGGHGSTRASTTSWTDAPARLSEWVPAFAEALNARRPRRVPEWLARMVAGNATGNVDEDSERRHQCSCQVSVALGTHVLKLQRRLQRAVIDC